MRRFFTVPDSSGNFVIEVVDSSDQVTLTSSEANGEFALQIKNNENTLIAEIVKSDSVAPVSLQARDINIANILLGNEGKNILIAGEQNDWLYGGAEVDILQGNGGEDKLYGGEGDDTLRGNYGNDRLEGGEGTDTYIFNRGDGRDTIIDDGGVIQFESVQGTPSLSFTNNFVFTKQGQNLHIRVDNNQDVTIENYYDNTASYSIYFNTETDVTYTLLTP